MEDQPKEPKRLQATPEEFERLLRGEIVNLSLEGGKEHSCLQQSEWGAGFIQVKDLKVEGISKLSKTYSLPIHITGHTIIDDLEISHKATCSGLIISGEAAIEGFSISGEAKVGDFSISGEAKVGDFSISDEATTGDFSISGEATTGDFSISGEATTGNFIISDEATTGYFRIYGEATTGVFWISGEATTGDFRISGEATTGVFWISEEASMRGLSISEKVNIGDLLFVGGTVSGQVRFYQWQTNHIRIRGIGTKLPPKVIMSEVKCHSLRFTDCHLAATLQMTDVGPIEKGEGFLEFTRSSFDKLELVGNRFEDFGFMSFTNSDITKTFMAETSFPEEVRSLKMVDDMSYYAFNHQQTKLFAEQLKLIHQSQGNRTEALYYQAKELDAHYQELNWGNHLWDKLTLAFNKWTTNFGTSWVRGLGALLMVSFFLYALLLLFSWPSIEILKDWQKWSSEFVEFMNPTSHIWKRWDYVYELNNLDPDKPKDVLPVWIKAWLLFSKVVIVTMIYQIVQAFRKFGKR